MKIKLMLIPICIGLILLFFSWYLSYPISLLSPYDFIYNNISILYWLSLPILFASFFIVAIKTRNNTLQWIMTVSTVLLMYSTTYFFYMMHSSDSLSFIGLMEHFISTGDLDPTKFRDYYQWPIFFILNKMAILVMGLELRYFEFILYNIIGVVLTSFLYIYTHNAISFGNNYISVISYFIILSYFFNYQWAPYTLCMCYLLLLIYLDKISEKREIIISILIIFYIVVHTQIIVPMFFIIYCFLMYVMNKKSKYLYLFSFTSIIFIIVQINIAYSSYYIEQLTNFYLLEFQHRIEQTLSSTIAQQPYIDIISQSFSRLTVITTTIVTSLGFIILVLRKELRKRDYSILLTGIIFIPTLIISFKNYSNIFWRAFPLIFIPVSLGTSYFSKIKFKKYFEPLFLILLLLFTFVMIHKTFYDRQIYIMTMKEYHNTNFIIDNVNDNIPISIFSHFRVNTYLRAHVREGAYVKYWTDRGAVFPQYINRFNYIIYTVGLGKSFLRCDYSVEKTFREFEINHFNLIYSSGSMSNIFYKKSK